MSVCVCVCVCVYSNIVIAVVKKLFTSLPNQIYNHTTKIKRMHCKYSNTKTLSCKRYSAQGLRESSLLETEEATFSYLETSTL
jgi:hypothetical protein